MVNCYSVQHRCAGHRASRRGFCPLVGLCAIMADGVADDTPPDPLICRAEDAVLYALARPAAQEYYRCTARDTSFYFDLGILEYNSKTTWVVDAKCLGCPLHQHQVHFGPTSGQEQKLVFSVWTVSVSELPALCFRKAPCRCLVRMMCVCEPTPE